MMIELTMLTEMMDSDLELAIERLKAIGIRWLDLKGGVFGKTIENLDAEEGERLARILSETGTEAYSFSSVLGHWNVARTPETEFRRMLQIGVQRLIGTCEYVQPKLIRLLACTFDERNHWADANEFMEEKARWVYSAYRDAVDALNSAGLVPTIENEPGCVFAHPAETLGFFERLDRKGRVFFTWDVQNMWQSGTCPTIEVYENLRPITDYVHLKGGKGTPENPRVMAYRSLLEDAGWPVRDIVRRVIEDGTSPVICLNSSHGQPADDYPLADLWGTSGVAAEEARRDADFLRRNFEEIA